jgi:hypothetical protein
MQNRDFFFTSKNKYLQKNKENLLKQIKIIQQIKTQELIKKQQCQQINNQLNIPDKILKKEQEPELETILQKEINLKPKPEPEPEPEPEQITDYEKSNLKQKKKIQFNSKKIQNILKDNDDFNIEIDVIELLVNNFIK